MQVLEFVITKLFKFNCKVFITLNTLPHAQLVVLVNFTLVDIVARAIILSQLVSRIAGTPVAAPEVDALLLAQTRQHMALVDVEALRVIIVIRSLLEACLALAIEGSNGIEAVGVRRTHTLVQGTLVDVHTGVAASRETLKFMARGTGTDIATVSVAADLSFSTVVLASGALVDVYLKRNLFTMTLKKIGGYDYNLPTQEVPSAVDLYPGEH